MISLYSLTVRVNSYQIVLRNKPNIRTCTAVDDDPVLESHRRVIPFVAKRLSALLNSVIKNDYTKYGVQEG